MTARRFLALHLPRFATDRIRRAEPALPRGQPLATWAPAGNRRQLEAVDEAAAAAGLHPGQALADAQAILPGLALRNADPAADAESLHALALWARRYSPLSATDPPDGLLLDIAGCVHLFGDEATLLRDALARLHAAGIAAQGAVAGHAATAGALARSRADNPITVSGIEAAAAGPLLIAPALRLEPRMLAALHRLGLRRVRDLLDQPRGPLTRRFGRELMQRVDAVAGRRHTVLQPALPPPALDVAQGLLEPIITRAGIDLVLDRLLEALCRKLRDAGLGLRRAAFVAWRVDGAVQEVAIGTGMAVRDPTHLRRLFRDRLERFEPGLGFERMALEARATEPMGGAQSGFAIGTAQDAAAAETLAQLLDRLAQRVPVRRAAPLASHWPEYMVAPLGPHDPVPDPPPGWPPWDAPVLLLRRPLPIEAVAPLDGPPVLLRWRGAAHRVLQSEGPRRLEPEWWRGANLPPPRDYHRVELASGARLWVCRLGRQGERWVLHGYLG